MIYMRRRDLLGIVIAAAAWPLTGRTQQRPERGRVLGVLLPSFEGDEVVPRATAALREELEKLGWSEGPRFAIDLRTGSNPERVREDAAVLVRLNPDVILVSSAQTLSELLRAKPTGPIVFMNVSNPVQQGFIRSLARPGGNITGLTSADEAFTGKRLELLKQLAPNISRILIIGSRSNPAWIEQLSKHDELAARLQLRFTTFDSENNEELERVVRSFAQAADGGIDVPPSIYAWVNREAIVALAARFKLPAVYPYRVSALSGGLMAYSFDGLEQWWRVAAYIDRILRGEKPSDLPVQQPTQFQLVINLKTANELGLTPPPILLARADEVIE
jgi:putative tryptophan/tyrosine transport system substrate-binding protein